MNRPLVADLGLGPEIWVFLSLLSILTVFFKFGRLWSVRNLDLLLLFAVAPGMMNLVASYPSQPWWPFVGLFAGSGLWMVRCLADLGLTRRPLLEPNLNGAGMTCAAVGLLGLLVAEAVNLPVAEGVARNPADPTLMHRTPAQPPPGATDPDAAVSKVLRQAPLPSGLRRKPPQVIVARVLASLSHLGLVLAMYAIGARHFERPIAGLCVAVCYLICPYSRIAVVDSGQLVPAALVVTAVLAYPRPAIAGALIGLAGGWMPTCLGLIPLWIGFYRRRGAWKFAVAALAVAGACGSLAWQWPGLAEWARALGARSLAQAGLVPGVEAPRSGSFWSQIDPSYRLPVLIAYLAMVGATAIWPGEKNLGELIALSAALLVAGQFWYLDEGGTLVLTYLPLVLLMMFRPNLGAKRPPIPRARAVPRTQPSLSSV